MSPEVQRLLLLRTIANRAPPPLATEPRLIWGKAVQIASGVVRGPPRPQLMPTRQLGQDRPRMAKARTTWNVLSHGPLERLADNLWRVEGSLPGMSLRRTMTVVRRFDGSLLLHSPIALDDARCQELEALGPIAVLVVPNAGHRLDAPAYQARYPSVVTFCPRGARRKVEEVASVSGTYDDYQNDGNIRFETLAGVADAEGAMLVRSSDGVTVVLNDVVMNMDKKQDLLGYLFTTAMGSAPGPRVSRLVRLLFVKDQPALRRHLERLAETPQLQRLIVAHEKVAHGPEAAKALREAATYLAAS